MNPISTLVAEYLRETQGSYSYFAMRVRKGDRVGQAFFNSLSHKDQARLRGTSHDPFHKNDKASIYDAVDFLTRPTKGNSDV